MRQHLDSGYEQLHKSGNRLRTVRIDYAPAFCLNSRSLGFEADGCYSVEYVDRIEVFGRPCIPLAGRPVKGFKTKIEAEMFALSLIAAEGLKWDERTMRV